MTSNTDSTSSEDLTSIRVGRALAGDLESTAWIIRRFSPLLLAHARLRMSPHLSGTYDPDDLVADTWAAVLPRLGTIARDGRSEGRRLTPILLTYLTKTQLRLYNKYQRRWLDGRPRAAAMSSTDDQEFAAVSAQVLRDVATRESIDQVLAALDELKAVDRALVVHRLMEGISFAELGERFGMSPSGVAMRVFRAVTRLRGLLPNSVFADLET